MNCRRDWNWVTVAETQRYLRRTVELIGVVVETGIPHPSKGPDHCVVLKIIDDSGTDRELTLNFFNRDIHDLPRLRSHLDIVLLSRVRISDHNQNPCVSVSKCSYFALFDGTDVTDCIPYQHSPGFTGLQIADKFVTKLRRWSSTVTFDAGVSSYSLRLAEINTMEFFDLVCKVLHVCEVSDGNWMLFVWDGTDAPPISLSTELADEEWNTLPLHIEPLPLPEHVLRKFPCVGTVLRVVVDENYESFGFHFQYEGKWVRLRNLSCKPESGLWKGTFTLETKVRLLSEQDNSVRDRLRVYYDRLSTQGRIPSARTPGPDVLTVIGNEDSNFATLLDLLCSPLMHGGFKCIVRVVAAYPSRARNFRSPGGLHRLRLTLEDPTARIHAYLTHKDAAIFFGGNMEDSAVSYKMNKLLGVDESGKKSTKNPPWVPFCIGFDSSDEVRQFHICQTAFAM